MLNTENENLKNAKKGSLLAFEKILLTYEKAIFNYLYRLTQHQQNAEDLTQETFIKVFKNLNTIQPNANLKSWIYTIATNTTKDFWRQKNRKKEVLFDSTEDLETISQDIAYYSVEEFKESSLELQNALNKLKPEYKIVILLYFEQEFSYQEIAQNLNIPINTVKTYIYRAKKALKETLLNS